MCLFYFDRNRTLFYHQSKNSVNPCFLFAYFSYFCQKSSGADVNEHTHRPYGALAFMRATRNRHIQLNACNSNSRRAPRFFHKKEWNIYGVVLSWCDSSIMANWRATSSTAIRCLRYKSDSLIAKRSAVSRILRPCKKRISKML